MSYTDPHESEYNDVGQLFDLDKILQFTRKHTVEIVRGGDWQFMCYIDGKCYGTGLTTLGAMVYGIDNYEKQ